MVRILLMSISISAIMLLTDFKKIRFIICLFTDY